MEKLVITCAITGSQTTRNDSPYLPVTPKEIARSAIEACHAGASLIHVHVRDDDGAPLQDLRRFQEVADRVRAETEAIFEVSTGGHYTMSAEERISSIDIEPAPEMASFNAGSMNFGAGVFINSLETLSHFAQRMNERGVKPEFECFDCGMIDNVLRFIDRGVFTPPHHFSLVLGVPGGISASPRNFLHMVESIPPESTWSVVAVGRHQFPLATMAMAMGGHVRVGMEDNVYLTKGVLAESNAEMVAKMVRLANEFGRPVASAVEARRILGLNSKT